jgi:DNA helicase II / ATP-dependent DNA helicase PcrA
MKNYNKQQLQAINSNSRTILCLAGAGAGKTATLLGRIERQVREGVDPRSILALTFTNAAAFEMKERYKQLPGVDFDKGIPEFKTFHGFCYSLIIKDIAVRNRLGYVDIPEVCEDAQMKEIRARVKLAIDCKLSDAILDNDNVILSKSDEDMKKLFKKALIKELRKENVITFDIMCYNVCELFERNAPEVEKYKQKYRYVVVDEFQDSDLRQIKFLNSFPPTTNFWLCADALQNIYAFRGTSNKYVKQLSILPGWEVIKLFKNYRSTIQICEFANKFSRYASDDYRITMEGQREGDKVEVIYGSNSSYNHPVDLDHLSILVDKLRENKRETAILCRTNKECGAVRAELAQAGIQFTSRTKSTDHVNLLDSALSNEYMLEWLSTKLDGKEYSDYVRMAAQVDNPDIRWFLNTYSRNDKIKLAADKVIEIRTIAASKDSPSEKFNKITKMLRVKTKCEFLGDEHTTSKEVVESIREQVQQLEEAQIYVGTIHSSKGLEYDTVYIMGVNDTMFRLGTEEMNNLYYVALTRAKNHLTIFRR